MFSPQLPPQQLYSHAVSLHRAGNFAAAADVYRQVLRAAPNSHDVLDKLGTVLTAMGQAREGRALIERAIKLAPSEALYQHDLHLTYRREGKWKEAEGCVDKALKLAPRHPIFTAAKAELAAGQGEPERAIKTLTPILGTAGEHPPVALVYAALAPRFGAEKDAAAALRKLPARGDVAGPTKTKLEFALAFLLDQAGDSTGAWEALRAGNSMVGAKWDAEAHRRSIDAAIGAWSKATLEAAPSAAVDGSKIVLVVGMPRSGASLVTSMLAGADSTLLVSELNDLIFAARELQGGSDGGAPIFTKPETLTAAALTERARTYANRLHSIRPEAVRYVDRLPMNFLNLGLIAKLLPGVRVIHMQRDRADLGMACYANLFTAVLPFMYDLTSLGSFVRDADRLMAHWRSIAPMPILDVGYEEMLERPEAVARRVIEFVGLPWRAEALEPARNWVQTVTLPSGAMRDLVPDGRVGFARDYASMMGEYETARSRTTG